MERAAEGHRRSLGASQSHRVEVWCESDSVGGVQSSSDKTRPIPNGLMYSDMGI